MVHHVEQLRHDVCGQQSDGHVDEVVCNQDGGQEGFGLVAQLEHELAFHVVARFQIVDVGRLEREKSRLAARNQGRSHEEQTQYRQSDEGVDIKSKEKVV